MTHSVISIIINKKKKTFEFESVFYKIVQKVINIEVIIQDITRYIDFLIETNKFSVTLHGSFTAIPGLIRYNFHLNPYCRFVKTVTGNWDICVDKQSKVFKKCEAGDFFGVCHAGVGEYVYPVTVNEKNVGFISVGGFKGKDESEAQSKAKHFARKNHIDWQKISNLRNEFLNADIPDKEKIDTVIHPLMLMLETYLQKYEEFSGKEEKDDIYTSLLSYITTNHNTRITMKDLSKKFNCSVSTLSHIFKKRSGVSISEYIENLRLDEARWLLKQNSYTVTEISDSLGFCNPAYFSSVFKKKFGVSPRRYNAMFS